MLIVKFSIRGTLYTWFVHENWVLIITFLLSVLSAKIVQTTFFKKRTKKLPNPRSGAFIEECIDPEQVYQIVDPTLEIIVRKMLGIHLSARSIVISGPVLIAAYLFSQGLFTQLRFRGVQVYIWNIVAFGAKIIGAVGSGVSVVVLAAQYGIGMAGLIPLASVVLGLIVGLNVFIGDVNCQNILSPLPQERVTPTQVAGFLETPAEKTPKIFVKDSEDVQIYSLSSSTPESCKSLTTVGDLEKLRGAKKSPVIKRKCDREYVPLAERTKTMADLKREYSTEKPENREIIEPTLERYRKRRERILNSRHNRQENQYNSEETLLDRIEKNLDE